MGARLLYRFKEAYGYGVIEGVIWDVPAPVPPSEHRVKYRLVFVVKSIWSVIIATFTKM